MIVIRAVLDDVMVFLMMGVVMLWWRDFCGVSIVIACCWVTCVVGFFLLCWRVCDYE